MGGHHGGVGYGEHVLGRLELTVEQKASVVSIVTAAHSKLEALHDDEKALRETLEKAKPEDANYAATATGAATKAGDLAKAQVQIMTDAKAAVYKLLTAEQKTKLAALEADEAFRRVAGGDGREGSEGMHGPMGGPNGGQMGAAPGAPPVRQ